ncbi:MAG: glycosyltransferase family 39 protein [Clostridia bacterium]|nr:glycosyltransferase family 39 protein [Clostridia bacterium]
MRRRALALALLIVSLLLPAASMAAENLLTPWDFTGRAALPVGWVDEAWYEGTDEYAVFYDEAQQAVCIRNYVDNDARFCYTLHVKENTCYTLSCLVKTEDVVRGRGANVSVTDTLAASAPLVGTWDWQRIELTGRTGQDQTELTVCVRVGGYGELSAGTAWFKDFTFYEAADTPAAVDFFAQRVEAEEPVVAGKVPYLGAIILSTLVSAFAAVLVGRVVIQRKEIEHKPGKYDLFLLLAGAFVLRIALSLLVYGHPTDIQCFMSWGNALVQNGYGAFYTSGMFADYPPGYMHVLGFTSGLAKLLGLSFASDGYVILTKMPAILCDLLSAYFVYRAAEKRVRAHTALWLCALVAFNPVIAYISGGWGQIDSVLTLLMALSIWLFLQDKRILAGAVYGLAIAAKPQALMLGPLLAAAYFANIKTKKDAYKTLAAVAAALGLIFLLALPFRSTQEAGWLLNKYFSTATSYPYASIEAYNLMALLGGNWRSVTDTPFLFSYKAWGTFFILVSVAVSVFVYLRARKREGMLWLCAAYLFCSIFMLGHYMHERYLYPALLFALMAFIQTKDKRLYTVYAWLSVSLLLNALGAFVIIDHPVGRGLQYDTLVFIGSLLNVGGWGYFSYVLYDRAFQNGHVPAFTEQAPVQTASAVPVASLEELPQGKLFTNKDRLLCFGLTMVYAIVALWNLGSLKAPESAWRAYPDQTVTISLEDWTQVKEVWIFGGISEGSVAALTGAGVAATYDQTFDDMFRWVKLPVQSQTDSLTLAVTAGRIWINEIAVRDAADQPVKITSVDAPALTDEQDTVPDAPSHLNGMYFDELYHGRTAYEHLHGLTPYENSHPPLGKMLIMLGVAVFGMNPFGWRIAGALLGIAMLPILYAFAKRLFKRSDYAFLASALFACDFMHFTQTRIATIDVYAVFFILLMYDFMYQYFCTDFFRDGLKKTLKPLGLAGLFFGMGAASKWTCIYAGGGLAVILLIYLVERYKESRVLLASADAAQRELGGRFWRYTIKTLLWCCLFYILVPVTIYLLSYLPYCLSEAQYDLKGIWNLQKFMFNYHSGLTATHPYQSAWWQWPLDIRPTWYYVGNDASGMRAGTISAFGNPAVWWVCSAGTVALLVQLLRDKIPCEKGMTVLLIGAAANYLPWVLVPRCTFTYHYFPMVPFIILCTVYLVRDMETRLQRPYLKWMWLGVCAALFLLFYPVISGTMVSTKYIHALEWLPSWTFLGY